MRLSLLGPVELTDGTGALVAIGPAKRRTLLAILGLELNQVVAVERLLDLLWEGDPPARARTALQGHVSALRKLLGPGMRLETRDPGYMLAADPAHVDVFRFRELVAAAGAADDAAATAMLNEALGLWRGTALADLTHHGLPEALTAGLQEMRLDALAALAQRLLRAGRGAEAVTALRAALESEPLHEPLITGLVLCLHQAGRQADALGIYHAARQRLAAELGVDPGATLQEAYHGVLHGNVPSGPPAASARAAPAGAASGGPVQARARAIPAKAVPEVPVPAQLPRAPSGFVGRRPELGWLSDHLGDDRPLLIDGPAGVGKSALVLRWAHQVAGKFPDGQLFASLRGFDPAGPAEPGVVLAGFLGALGTAVAAIPDLLEDRAALYRTRMAGRHVLVVLDDASDVDQIRPLLPGDEASLVVITSRHRLDGLIAGDGAAARTVAAVSSREALSILGRVLGNDVIESDRGAALRLASLCDHLPLALRVAAARLATSPGMPVSELVEELRDEQQRLAALATADANLSVEAALSLSYRTLPAPAARLFMLLGLNPGPDISVWAAAALGATTTGAARRALTSLTGCHLAYQATPGRFAAHDLVRLYARGLVGATLEPEDQAAALGRLFDYYLAATQAARLLAYPDPYFGGYGPVGTYQPATPDLADLNAAFSWYAAEEESIRALVTSTRLHEHAWRLAYNNRLLYSGTGRNADQEAYLVAGLVAARAAGSRLGAAQVLTHLGNVLTKLGRHQEALGCLRDAAALMGEEPEPRDKYRLMMCLADAELAVGDLAEAHRCLTEALDTVRKIDRPVVEATTMGYIAHGWMSQSAPERALPYSQQAVDLMAAMAANPGNEIAHATVLQTHGWVLERLGRLDEAMYYLRRAIDISQRCGYKSCAAESHHRLGIVLAHLGQPIAAEQSLRVALDLYGILQMTAEAAETADELDELTAETELLSDLDRPTATPALARR
jgi:DNA-binding SARP family transcriptional activator/Tfp pilus assembly protein PilF